MNHPIIHLAPIDDEKEAELFVRFLNHPQFPQHRNYILGAFPELKTLLEHEKTVSEELIVRRFIQDFHHTRKEQIEQITSGLLSEIEEKLLPGISELSMLMEHQQREAHPGYTAVPTLLPFSPFEKDTFFFSILGELKGNKGIGIAFVGVHEISHFFLFDLLGTLYGNEGPQPVLGSNIIYILKEALAPAVMNQHPLKDLLDINDYLGNPELTHLYLSDKKGNVEQISMYFQNQFEKSRENKTPFVEFVQDMIQILLSIRSELDMKRDQWNRFGTQIYRDPDLLREYSKTIKFEQTLESAV